MLYVSLIKRRTTLLRLKNINNSLDYLLTVKVGLNLSFVLIDLLRDKFTSLFLQQELEFQIAEAYEQLLNRSATINQNEEILFRAYKTNFIKHRGYQLVIPKNMTVGHFLEDQSEIECQIVLNEHTTNNNGIKEEIHQVKTNQFQPKQVQQAKQVEIKQHKQKFVQKQSVLKSPQQVLNHESQEKIDLQLNDQQINDEDESEDKLNTISEKDNQSNIDPNTYKQNTSIQKSNHNNDSARITPKQKIIQDVLFEEDEEIINFLTNNESKIPQIAQIPLSKRPQNIEEEKVFKKNFKKITIINKNKPMNQPPAKKVKLQVQKVQNQNISQPSLFKPGEEVTLSSGDEIPATKPNKLANKKDDKKSNQHQNNAKNLFEDSEQSS